MRLSPNIIKDTLSILVVTLILLIVALFGLQYILGGTPPINRFNVTWEQYRMVWARLLGQTYDMRTQSDVLKACGTECRPLVNPLGYVQESVGGRLRIGPLYRDRKIVSCNESGQWITYRADKFGFRENNAEHFVSANVVMVGDSMTDGVCVAAPDDFASKLRRTSGKSVLNLGVGGNSPLDELAVLKEYGPERNFDVLVWVYYEGNDWGTEIYRDYLRRYLTPEFVQSERNDADDKLIVVKWSTEEQDKLRGDNAPSFLWLVSKVLAADALSGVLALRRVTMPASEADERFPQDLPLLTSILEEAKRFSRNRGATKFVFVYLPAYERFAYKRKSETPIRQYDRLKQEMRQISGNLGFDFVDMAEEFYRTGDPLSHYFFRSHAHLNSEGNRVLVDAIVQRF